MKTTVGLIAVPGGSVLCKHMNQYNQIYSFTTILLGFFPFQ